ncbi:hypothetical protein [Mucilaginibacter phyllosphaerae]
MLILQVMMDYLTQFKEWVISLGEKHDVDPLTLGSLYFISKVSCFTLLGFVLKNIRAKKPFLTLVLLAGVCFTIPYVYIMIVGRNIPFWVYILIGLIFTYGAYSIWKKVTEKQEIVDAKSSR